MIKKQVTTSIKAGYQGSTHTYVDTSALVWRIANAAREFKLQKWVIDREGNKRMKRVVDVLVLGYKKMESSSLGTFNKKIAAMKEGHPTDMEVDSINLCGLAAGGQLAEDETVEISALHDEEA
jgi:hypothetical protein